jgi:signal transduction histidine kinase
VKGNVFRRLPIRHKLVAMIMITATAVLLLASAGYMVADYYRARRDLQRDLHAQALLVLENSRAPLMFLNEEEAQEAIESLRANPNVRTACLYDGSGALYAQFLGRSGATACAATPEPPGVRFDNNRLILSAGLDSDGKRLGTLLIRSDIELLRERFRFQAFIVIALLLVALAVALAMSARLQVVVSHPVTSLARTATEVSSRGDYSLRAERTTEDELGVLVDAFNRMLERIQVREAELSTTNEELRREIVERRRAEQERAELLVREREANRLKDEFLATLSHELRTPLNAILGWTKLLRTNVVPPAGVDRALEKVQRNAEVQSRLVEDLLEVSRITTGKLRLDVRPFDLVTLANTAIDSIRPTAEARGVAIERRFDSFTLPTAGDPDRLQQVIWNLLSNAVKFTPAGGIVTLALRREGEHDELIVSDTGIGIDPVFLPNVFDTFRQADASSTRAHGGLGLGLSIVRHLVEMHGGQVAAASEGAGTGATFTVRLPVRAVERSRPARSAEPPAPVENRLAGVNVVVVDDDLDTRELLVSILDRAGAQVRSAASAAEGLIACLELAPDALVSDIAMPGQDGYALMRQVQAALGPDAPRAAVALTAFAGDGDREQSRAAGFDQHVAKPVDPVALVRLLEDLLAEKV